MHIMRYRRSCQSSHSNKWVMSWKVCGPWAQVFLSFRLFHPSCSAACAALSLAWWDRCSLLVLHTFSCLTLTEKMATVESIKTLLDTSACNAEIVPQLVAHVHAQASGSVPYHADANRSLIKLYTFFPHLEDEHTIALVLLLALVEFPSTDILSLSCLIPERVQSRDPCASILSCADLLDSCQFEDFWSLFGALKGEKGDLVQSLAQKSSDRIVRSIVDVLALSYTTAPLSVVTGAINQTDAAVAALQQHAAIASVDLVAKEVHFVSTADNTKRNRVFQEGVNFSEISNMMTKSTAAAAE